MLTTSTRAAMARAPRAAAVPLGRASRPAPASPAARRALLLCRASPEEAGKEGEPDKGAFDAPRTGAGATSDTKRGTNMEAG